MQKNKKSRFGIVANEAYQILWGDRLNIWLLIFCAMLLLFFMLGAKELWTQEWRWANICQNMIIRHDYLHPFLKQFTYYDKPLLSYWLIIGVSKIIGYLNIWAVRLPSAIAGLLVIWCTYFLGRVLINKKTGLIAAWLLISSCYFIFWARVASADMLNLAGIMLAVTWYVSWRHRPGLFAYTVFFLILAIACLFKGLIAVAIIFIVIFPDLIHNNNYKKYLSIDLITALIIGISVYLIPFGLSHHYMLLNYNNTGLRAVFRENILRYFHPYDHKGPFYLYLIYLPIFIFPWIFFFIPAVMSVPGRWKKMKFNSRWIIYAASMIFLFLTCSGSRRYYYILPVVPFVILFIADWIQSDAKFFINKNSYAGKVAILFVVLNIIAFNVVEPIAYKNGGGLEVFAQDVRQQATRIKPWKSWKLLFIDTRDKVSFYLDGKKLNIWVWDKTIEYKKNELRNNPPDRIIILNRQLFAKLQFLLQDKFIQVHYRPTLGERITGHVPDVVPIALIPKSLS